MEIILFSDVYSGKRVLITGHTGFKGSWLSLWMNMLGANVKGIALTPETSPSHWNLLNLDMPCQIQDIQQIEALRIAINDFNPEIVFHLAAQPLVKRSYKEPLMTWNTNVMGTLHLLEICRELPELKAIVVITTDKCYENKEFNRGYKEEDPLGGYDPYSASKAATELLVSSYRDSFYSDTNSALLASARAGNVIGGGDWSEDRLVPDLIRAMTSKTNLKIRYPNATRPWQHILESVYGYLLLGQRLLVSDREFAQAWNFGPEKSSNVTVSKLLEEFKRHWPEISWEVDGQNQLHEAGLLYLDSGKAKKQLGWIPVLDFEKTVQMTADWYRNYLSRGSVISQQQIQYYSSLLSNTA